MWDLVVVVGDSLPALSDSQAMGCQATHALNKSPEARRRQSSCPLDGFQSQNLIYRRRPHIISTVGDITLN
jgi:hypothetical protein